MITTRTRSGARDWLLAAFFEASPIAMLHVERRAHGLGVIAGANPAAAVLCGRPVSTLVGVLLDDVLAGAAGAALGAEPTLVQMADVRGHRWLTASVTPLDGAAGGPGDHALVILQDVTENRIAQERLDRAAREDSLTGLANRAELMRVLTAVDPATDGPWVAAIFVDLDNFKRVNDSQGHHVGDDVLVAVARRIRSVVRPEDTVARLGGDEFVVLCPRLDDPRDAGVVADRVRATLDGPVSVAGATLRLSMSCGISSARADAVGEADLLRRADAAMYRAKAGGGNRVHHLLGDDPGGPSDAVSILETLRAATAEPEGDPVPGLALQWHPVVDIATGQVSYVEASVRLRDRAGALLAPWQFMPVAAREGLAMRLGAAVVRTALQVRAGWPRPQRDWPVGVDVAADLVGSADFAPAAEQAIARTGHRPADVVLQVAESCLAAGGRAAMSSLRRLHGLGFGLALDRFGSGGAALTSLQAVGPHRVKVDWRLLGEVTARGADHTLLAATVAAAHALGQRVVAEGVDTPAQLEVLASLGCDEVQGGLVAAWSPGGPGRSLRGGRRAAAAARVPSAGDGSGEVVAPRGTAELPVSTPA